MIFGYDIQFWNLPIITSITLFGPVVYWTCCHSNTDKNSTSLLFLILIIINMSVMSCFFWSDPIGNRNTIVHRIDAVCARFTIFTFISYNIYYQVHNIHFFFAMASMFVFFYLSHHFSGIEWCSEEHIYSHICAHFFALAGIYFTFFIVEDL